MSSHCFILFLQVFHYMIFIFHSFKDLGQTRKTSHFSEVF
ncbi:unnamed protein product [Brassica rapa subsp. trilocularis]